MTTMSKLKKTDVPELLDEILFFNILKRVPGKSLFKFRCVNKHWRHTIDDPVFKLAHFKHAKQNPLLLAFIGEQHKIQKYCHYNFHTYGPGPHFSRPFNYLSFPIMNGTFVVGSCNGLLCLASESHFEIHNLTTHEILNHSNPIVSKFFRNLFLPNPNPLLAMLIDFIRRQTIFGFGFDPLKKEYKFIRIFGGYECMIYTLGTASYRDITETSNLFICFMCFNEKSFVSSIPLYSNRALYWFCRSDNVLIWFDLHKEKFCWGLGPHHLDSISDLYMVEWQGHPCLAYHNLNSERINLYFCHDEEHHTQLAWVKTSILFPFSIVPKCKIDITFFLGQIICYWFKDGELAMYNLGSTQTKSALLLRSLGLESALNFHMQSGLINHTENLFSLKEFVPCGESHVRYMHMNQVYRPMQEVPCKEIPSSSNRS